MKKIILHIDMNSYFASVEQQANPFLRGRVVGVCAYLTPSGTIIASSREAKAKGIKTGTKVFEAKKMDSKIILVQNDPAKYRSTTNKIFKILKEYTDTFEPYSIDEAFLDMTGWVSGFGEAKLKAEEIKKRIIEEVGEYLHCSIGISYTKFLAKFAGDIAPKKGILVLNSDSSLESVIKNRDLKDAWGINKRTEAKLNSIGIYNLFQLKKTNSDFLRRKFGRYGYYLWCHLNGIEIDRVKQETPKAKSIGHSYVLPKTSSNREYLKSIFYKLCEKTGRKLRSSGQEANGISISLTYARDGRLHKSFKTKEKLFTTREIFREVESFLNRQTIILETRGVAVVVTRLNEANRQMNLFEDNLALKDLSQAMDKINNKYGEYTVIEGEMFGRDQDAPDRIGFRKAIFDG